MEHWKETPELGNRYCFERIVTEEMSAVSCGSGNLHVLATPALVAALEEASFRSVGSHLLDGYDTVGTHVCLDHIKATAIGEKVTFSAELVKIEGRSLTFKVFAEDSTGLIGQGKHQRFVICTEQFIQRVNSRC